MTNKELQVFINTICVENYREALSEITSGCNAKTLRSCKAKVIETVNYYILVSYETVVAVIDKLSDTLYDVLRYAYGYTSTSNQHIAKFEKDYSKGNWECEMRLTYRDL